MANDSAGQSAGRQGRQLTRSDVAATLGVSIATVRRMEDRGELRPQIGRHDVRYFDVKEVRELAARRPRRAGTRMTRGEIAAAVFRRLDALWDLRRIVLDLQVEPKVVQDLHRAWEANDLYGNRR